MAAAVKGRDSTTTIRIRERTLRMLRELASEEGKSMTDVLHVAVDAYRRKRFLEEANKDFERLQADPEAWKDYQDELRLWDATLMDGLEEYPFDADALPD